MTRGSRPVPIVTDTGSLEQLTQHWIREATPQTGKASSQELRDLIYGWHRHMKRSEAFCFRRWVTASDNESDVRRKVEEVGRVVSPPVRRCIIPDKGYGLVIHHRRGRRLIETRTELPDIHGASAIMMIAWV